MNTKEVEVVHWDKFKARANFHASMVPAEKVPVPSSRFKERVERSFPGLKLQWTTLDSGHVAHQHANRYPPITNRAVGIVVSASPL